MEKKYLIKEENVTFEQIYETLQKDFNNLQEQYSVKTLGIFGSYTRGEATEKSDIDFLIAKIVSQPLVKNIFKFC